MKSIFSFFQAHPRTALLLLGAVCALPFQLPALFLAPFLALIGVFLLLEKQALFCRARSLWTMGFSFFFGYNAVIYLFFLWMYPLEVTGFSPALALAVVLLAWLGISAAQGAISAFVFPLFALVSRRRSSWLGPLAFASLWVVFEWLLEQGTLGFPWNRLASGLVCFTPFLQSASLLGSLFLSFLAVVIPSYLALALKEKRFRKALPALVLLACNLLYGLLTPVLTQKEQRTLTVSVIQGNILSGEKWEADKLDQILETYVALTREAAGSDLILWPETAVPVNLSYARSYEELYASLSEELQAPLLMGAILTNEEGTRENAVALIDKNGIVASYAKRHLVPFGEYLPWREVLGAVLPFLEDINQLSDDLAAGTDSEIMNAQGVKIGALVCFDSAFASLSRDAAADGAELLLLATNDSWYRDSAATTQHLSQCVLRAVENRRSVAVAANSGISAFVTPYGSVSSSLAPLREGVLTDTVTVRGDTTLYTLWGDWPILGICLVLCTLTFAYSFKGRKDELQ